jgi:protein-L-isoaspartate(D-aspartate) O-methyltransferase
MDRDGALALARRAYAKKLMVTAGVTDPRMEEAYATVPREHFLGRGPWKMATEEGPYAETPSDDPVHLYTDSVVGILPERQLNSGQPSFHVSLMAHAAPRPGEHVVHIGIGVGYYSAILAELVGLDGRVTAIEFDPELATRARINLQRWPNIEVIHGDGTATPFQKADVIYVSAGTTRPADLWLDQLAEGGRLSVPLTIDTAYSEQWAAINPGAVFQIERRGDDYLARWISVVAIFPCAGARDEVSGRALAEALRNGREKEVTRLYRKSAPSDEQCWLRAPGWCLAYS